MPVINFSYQDLCSLLGEDVPVETLIERIPLVGADMHDTEGDEDEMSVEFFPDRPDMFCVEGLARSMRAFLDIEPGMTEYEVEETDIEAFVDPSVEDVRPVFLCAAVFDVEISDAFLRSMMEVQEKLHITIGRKRSKLAIGIHDLDKVSPPFTYKAVGPHEVSFVPLAKTEEWDLEEILVKHEKGKDYAHLVQGMDRYPLLVDSEGNVLSFPPIINGALTTVTTETRNLLVDVTGFDMKTVKGALDIIVTALAERGGSIGAVTMHYGDSEFQSPDLSPADYKISASDCEKFLGIEIGPDGVSESLRRMGLDAKADGDAVYVEVPATRLDIMHEVDIYEDVAIGYGFDRFGGRPYKLDQTIGALSQATVFSDSVKDIMVGMGFMEFTTLTLSCEKDEFCISGLPETDVVKVLNPITEEHTCLRSSLMPSLMRIVRRNKHRDLPQRIFEVGTVIRDARKSLHLCALVTASKTSFTEIKSIAEKVLRELGAAYSIEVCDLPTFIPGRGAYVVVDGARVGMFGEMAPQVVVDFEINHPVIMFELDLDGIMAGKSGRLF
jgi:phenylalanyl-tRNA synthetase beta chain